MLFSESGRQILTLIQPEISLASKPKSNFKKSCLGKPIRSKIDLNQFANHTFLKLYNDREEGVNISWWAVKAHNIVYFLLLIQEYEKLTGVEDCNFYLMLNDFM